MRSLQEHQLFHESQQEKIERKTGDEETLPVLQKAYDA
jgi:hypothetical protein